MSHAPSSAAGLAVALVLLASTGCTTTIVPPAAPRDPVTVYLLDHGRTSSLVIPATAPATTGPAVAPGAGDSMVRWVYGNWNWYALGHEGPLDAFAALFWHTQATLGRWQIDGLKPDSGGGERAAAVCRKVVTATEHVYPIQVERPVARQLALRLEALFDAHRASLVENHSGHLTFVHHPQAYCGLHNSNQMAAEWLRAMGCQTRGSAVFADWRVESAPTDPRK